MDSPKVKTPKRRQGGQGRTSNSSELPNASQSAPQSAPQSADPIQVKNVRQEDVSHIDHAVFRDAVNAPDLRRSLQEIVKLVHLDADRPWNVNAYVLSPEAEMGLCVWKGRWTPMLSSHIARLVMRNAASLMCEHNDDPYEDEYDVDVTARFEEFFNRLERDDSALGDTLETLSAGRRIVEAAHAQSPK